MNFCFNGILSDMDVLKRLFERHFHQSVERVDPLQGQLGGSGRKILRLSGGRRSAIGVLHDVREENVAFVEFSRHFRRHDLPVPEIYEVDLEEGAYIEEDFGDTTLFDYLSRNRAEMSFTLKSSTPIEKSLRSFLVFKSRPPKISIIGFAIRGTVSTGSRSHGI